MATVETTNFAKIPGLLKSNDSVRSEMLRRVFWRDRQYTTLGGDYVAYAEMSERVTAPVTSGKTLFAYTHDGATDYSHEINNKYLQPEVDVNVYENLPYTNDLHKWNGDYLENFQTNNTLDGIGTALYMQAMTVQQYANQDRFLEQKYITPELIKFYGSNPAIEGEHRYLSAFGNSNGIFTRQTGRIADIPEAQVEIVDDITEEIKNKDFADNHYFLYQTRENADKEIRKVKKNNNTESLFLRPYVNYDSKTGIISQNIFDGFKESANLSDEEKLQGASNITTIKATPENLGVRYITQDEGDDAKPDGAATLEIDEKDESHSDSFDISILTRGQSNLLGKTSQLFKEHKISTMVGRFHLSGEDSPFENSTIDSAVDDTYGNSHGRNLLKKNVKKNTGDNKTNGYENPYCRVWTYHHQYDKYSKLIRPFIHNNNVVGIEDIQDALNSKFRSTYSTEKTLSNGSKYLGDNTVLNSKNGLVNIAPKKDVDIKKCMFSLENLAWKDVPKNAKNLSKEQQGPNGGRIMWFPPYDLNFQENINVDWNSSDFIGRGEKVYTYRNTDRTGTLSFTMLIDHPSFINTLKNKTSDSDDGVHGDILRFFAGCQIPSNLEEKLNEEKENEKNNGSDKGKLTTSKEKGRRIKFYVYFPNNYSGNMKPLGTDKKTSKITWVQKGFSDEDWFIYLLTGKDTSTTSGDFNGYEISPNGISSESGDVIVPNVYTKDCTQWLNRKAEASDKGPYHYRVDYDLRQVLNYDANYTDSRSDMLNLNLNLNYSVDATCSFAEFMLALLKMEGSKVDSPISADVLEDYLLSGVTGSALSMDRVNSMINLFNGEPSFSEVSIKGAATKQDSGSRKGCDETNADMLAHRRSKALGFLLKNTLLNGVESGTYTYSDKEIIRVNELKDPTTVNSTEAKAQRYAVVEIILNTPEQKKVSEANVASASGISENMETTLDTTDTKKDEKEKTTSTTNGVGTTAIGDADVEELGRYETEAEYFENLSITDPFLFKNIQEKCRFFTPAFHSISPEGFNARLTFLHQCTRQGHTVEASDKNGYSRTAGNLSFGRMPVCVLRIGDFINTRIIINNLTINYEENGSVSWDLNPEGAGVQPIIAKITLGIVILGGQSLDGPISRLQNAVTFNYYANTGVYDNRADRYITDNKEQKPEYYNQVEQKNKELYLYTPYPNE